ncbi:MAG TPA: class I SAM-dependent methyltransferase [Candidatus Margulisiibacteriota bacterium]|nr:class I SAM-dependent methyltransferase [Candidatus Margulisiibacteriota bacterium]
MQADRYSRTALAAAFYRAQHHLHDEPKLFDDPYAHRLLTAGEMAALTERRVRDGRELGVSPGDPQTVLARALREITPAPHVLVRARYTEDRLATAVQRGVDQYVLVGAGFDTFAFRRTDLCDRLQVFELDHPQSQAVKRERLAAAGLAEPANLHFGTVDFERENIAEALGRLPFRRNAPTFFAWLGVTMYLTGAAVEETWRAMRSVAAPGSELVFDFIHPDVLSENAPLPRRRTLERARAVGEPMITGLDPTTLGAELHATGWTLIEQLDMAEIDRRYFATRTDGYRARPAAHLACAGVA